MTNRWYLVCSEKITGARYNLPSILFCNTGPKAKIPKKITKSAVQGNFNRVRRSCTGWNTLIFQSATTRVQNPINKAVRVSPMVGRNSKGNKMDPRSAPA